MRVGQDLGLAIALLRGERTQAECAKRAGLDPTTWSVYEAGKRLPRRRALERVLRGLRCSELELEEAVRRMRRQRLVYEQRVKAEEAAVERPPWEAVEPEPEEGPPWEFGPFERRELRALVTRYSAALEELLAFVMRARE